jgi:hypothetical protein
MTISHVRLCPAVMTMLALAFTANSAAAGSTANVSGKWTVSVTGAAGSATQTLVINQSGGNITGTFKGPRQSGTLSGTVTGNQVAFHVKAHVPIDYTGTADGDSMKGTLTGRGKTGEWTASRAK